MNTLPIRETARRTLCDAKTHEGNWKKLFNTSSNDYRNPELKAKLPDLSEQQIIDLLSQQGNLVKRPFLVGEDIMLQWFKPDLWEEAFSENNLRK